MKGAYLYLALVIVSFTLFFTWFASFGVKLERAAENYAQIVTEMQQHNEGRYND